MNTPVYKPTPAHHNGTGDQLEDLHFYKYFDTPISNNKQLQNITDKIIDFKTECLVTEMKFRNTEWCLKNGSCPTGLMTNIETKYYSEYENEDKKGMANSYI